MNVLQDILQELSETAQKNGSSSNSADTIIANIKSTMSDRAAPQKSFNTMLANYRSDILPEVVQNWDSLSTDEQTTLSQMHNFYCGMHLVVLARPLKEGVMKRVDVLYNLLLTLKGKE